MIRKVILFFMFCLFAKIELAICQNDSIKIRTYIIGSNYRNILPDSLRITPLELGKLYKNLCCSINYTEEDKSYLLAMVNDSFPDYELVFKYKKEFAKPYLKAEVEKFSDIDLMKEDSTEVLDSIYEAYFKLFKGPKPALPTDIYLMLGLVNDDRFIPFLKKKYSEGYQKAGFALGRMGKEPFLSKILTANQVDSLEFSLSPQIRNIHTNQELLFYLCSKEALELYFEYILANKEIIKIHIKGPYTEVDETGADRNYEFLAIHNIKRMMDQVSNPSLKADYKAYVKKLKEEIEESVDYLPLKDWFRYTTAIAVNFPYRSNVNDFQDVLLFLQENKERLTNPANYKCQSCWELNLGLGDFGVKRYKN